MRFAWHIQKENSGLKKAIAERVIGFRLFAGAPLRERLMSGEGIQFRNTAASQEILSQIPGSETQAK